MRSTQKDIARLYREVRQAIGVKTNQQASEHIAKALKYYKRKLSGQGISCIMLTPYRGGSWALYGVYNKDGSTRELTMYMSTEQMLDVPVMNYKRFLELAA
jgi:uncharacterized membrane protein YjjP (DUF1212 family)